MVKIPLIALSFVAALAMLVGVAKIAEAHVLHPGDTVKVTVYNHPELSTTVIIDASGNVSVPLAGTVSANNIEPDALARNISGRLAPYVRKVAVNVELTQQSDSIFVAGGPGGVLKYRPGETLTSVVDELQFPISAAAIANSDNVASRTAPNASLDLLNGPIDFRHVSILRDGGTLGPYDVVALRGSGDPGPALLPDDTIRLVNKPIAVSISGDVTQPGTVYLDKGDPLSQAVYQSGGVAKTSTLTNITLKRDGVSTIVSLGGAEFSQPAENGDILIFPRAPRVDVLGTVEHPGEAILRGDSTLVSALYYAGGPAKYANLRSVKVVHAGKMKTYDLGRIQKGGSGDNPALSDGDTVFVPQGSTFDPNTIWNALAALGLFGLHI